MERHAGSLVYDIVAHFPRWNMWKYMKKSQVLAAMEGRCWVAKNATWLSRRSNKIYWKLQIATVSASWILKWPFNKVIFTFILMPLIAWLVSALPRQSPCWHDLENGAKTGVIKRRRNFRRRTILSRRRATSTKWTDMSNAAHQFVYELDRNRFDLFTAAHCVVM